MEEELLDVLPFASIPELARVYKQQGCEDYGTYKILELIWRWKELDCLGESGCMVLTPFGRVDSTGTLVALFPLWSGILFDSLDPDEEKMIPFVEQSVRKFIKWDGPIVLGPIREKYWPIFEEIFRRADLTKFSYSQCDYYLMDLDTAMNLSLNCPEEVYLAPLKEEHAEIIDTEWPHRFEGSLKMIEFLICRNGGIGVFLKLSDNDELVSWAVHSHYNGPGFLQTIPSQRRKGYGRLATVAITQFVAKKNRSSCAYIIETNKASASLCTDLGYKQVGRACWVGVKKNPSWFS